MNLILYASTTKFIAAMHEDLMSDFVSAVLEALQNQQKLNSKLPAINTYLGAKIRKEVLFNFLFIILKCEIFKLDHISAAISTMFLIIFIFIEFFKSINQPYNLIFL